jgi:uncharacterized membrane protein
MARQPSSRCRGWTDEKIEQIVGNVLRTGVLLSAAVVAVGAVVYLARHGSELPHYRTFHGEPETLRSVPLIIQAVLKGSGRGIIQAGLLLLLATPIARVAMSAFAFGRQRDLLYIGVSLIVLTFLMISLLGVTR